MSDRNRQVHPLEVVEVMDVIPKNEDLADRDDATTVEEIAQLLEVIGCEDSAIAELDGCVGRLREVQAAKQVLQTLSADQVRQALQYRHGVLGGQSA